MAAGDGLISMTPTSIAHAGTSASINADGGVDFTAVTSLSLNGVFTGDYDNYLVVIDCVGSADTRLDARLRASGTDASGSNYTNQYLQAGGASVGAGRDSSETSFRYGQVSSTQRDGMTTCFYGPFLAQPTAMRTVIAEGTSSARITDRAGTHSLSTAYDGITLFLASNNFTGTVHVFGYEE